MSALFVAKYGQRVIPGAEFWAVTYAGCYVVGVAFAKRQAPSPQRLRWTSVLVVTGALALALFSPEANRVARLPALDLWLDRLAAGDFPYASPVRPSGFPGLYGLALPFWATASLRLLPVIGLAVFLFTAHRAEPLQRTPVVVGLVLLPSIWYEATVHSELFLNAALALASLWLFERARQRGGAALAGAAVVAGLLLSTRLVVGVVYAVWGAYAFRSTWWRGFAFAGIALVVWAATWLPFALWNPAQFAAVGPFSIQNLYLPTGAVLAGGVSALAMGWSALHLESVVSRVGWLLLALVSVSFALSVADLGFETALYDGFDLAYFILPTPFLLLALSEDRRALPSLASPSS